MSKLMKTFGAIATLLGLIIVLSVTVNAYTSFNLMMTIAFNNLIAYKVLVTIAGIWAGLGLILFLINMFKKIF